MRQVCSALNDSNRGREIEGIVEAMSLHKIKAGTVVTFELDATEDHDGHTIRFVPLWKWLLG